MSSANGDSFGADTVGASTQYALAFLTFIRRTSHGALTLNQVIVLLAVTFCYLRRERCRHADLMKSTGLSKGTVSRAVGTLRAAHLIVEERDPNDARCLDIRPSEGHLRRRRRFLEAYFIDPVPEA